MNRHTMMESVEFQKQIKLIMNAIPGKIHDVAYDDLEFDQRLELNALALAGEVGSLANHIKKSIWYERKELHGDLDNYMEKKLGDILFHVAELANVLELDMGACMLLMVNRGRARNNMQPLTL